MPESLRGRRAPAGAAWVLSSSAPSSCSARRAEMTSWKLHSCVFSVISPTHTKQSGRPAAVLFPSSSQLLGQGSFWAQNPFFLCVFFFFPLGEPRCWLPTGCHCAKPVEDARLPVLSQGSDLLAPLQSAVVPENASIELWRARDAERDRCRLPAQNQASTGNAVRPACTEPPRRAASVHPGRWGNPRASPQKKR